ncbi:MAG: CoA ester lyase, partial [Nitrososphaerota archaeon]|nr:CoA ester lyase [Nitrososphaerota archaeon]
FVPANDEKKIRKSVTLGADSVIFDLEDAVPVQEKSNARKLLETLLQEIDLGKAEVCVRINKFGSEYSPEDIAFVLRQPKVNSIVLPKAENMPEVILRCGKSIIPLVETPLGLLQIEDIVRSDSVDAVSYGPADLANFLGGKPESYAQNQYVKTKIVVAASAYGVDAIDCVFFDLKDSESFRREAMQSRNLGYAGKQVVHPSQLLISNEVFSPSSEEIESARKLIEIYEKFAKNKVGALRVDEKLVDAVHYRRAKSILETADVLQKE